MTHVDTAELYGAGAAEEMVAEVIAGRRDQVFLVSKVLPENASRRGTVAACENSLTAWTRTTWTATCFTGAVNTRLRTPSLPSSSFETRANFVPGERAISICPIWRRPQKIAGHRRLACNQVLYHLGQRAIEHTVLRWCEDNGVAVVGYSPVLFGVVRAGSLGDRKENCSGRTARAGDPSPHQNRARLNRRRFSAWSAPPASDPLPHLPRREEERTLPDVSAIRAFWFRPSPLFPKLARSTLWGAEQGSPLRSECCA
jgi:hypothetical protein